MKLLKGIYKKDKIAFIVIKNIIVYNLRVRLSNSFIFKFLFHASIISCITLLASCAAQAATLGAIRPIPSPTSVC